MTATAAAIPAMHRGAVTWYVYLLLGYVTFAFNMLGNVLPFLKAELDLSYRLVSLHSSAMATGMILTGLFGARIARVTGRRLGLGIGAAGIMAGFATLALAPNVFASLFGSFLIGWLGSLIPAIGFAVLSDDQPHYRDVAFSESNAVSYAFAIFAPLSMSAALGVALDWRVPLVAGFIVGGLLIWSFRTAVYPPTLHAVDRGPARLSAAFWAYWGVLSLSISMEFGVLLWAPAFLEQVVGLSKASAAGASAAFFLAMLAGRTAGGFLVRVLPIRGLFPVSLAVAIVGFFVYWTADGAVTAVAGLFVAGLGISLLFPLTLSLMVGAAGDREDAASARVALAGGLALLFAPVALGWIADEAGLRNALLIVPGLMVAAAVCFVVARSLERRLKLPV